jgi:hypothetical protein
MSAGRQEEIKSMHTMAITPQSGISSRVLEKNLERVSHLAFHEAYHVGQTGILRRIVGREGVSTPPRIPVTG